MKKSRQGQRQHLSRDEVNLLIYQASRAATGPTNQPALLSGAPSPRAFPDRKPIHPPSRLTTWLCLMVFCPYGRTERRRIRG